MRISMNRSMMAIAIAGAMAYTAPLSAQAKLSMGVSGTAPSSAPRASASISADRAATAATSVKSLDLSEAKPFHFLFRADKATACEEFPAGGKTAVSAAGFETNKDLDLVITPGHRWYPAQGSAKYVVIRCVSDDANHTIVSDSVRLFRK